MTLRRILIAVYSDEEHCIFRKTATCFVAAGSVKACNKGV
jgi:hypothetical protein